MSPSDVEAAQGADVRAERLPSEPAVGLTLQKTLSKARGAASFVKSATFDKVMKKKLKNKKPGTEVKRGLIKPDNSKLEQSLRANPVGRVHASAACSHRFCGLAPSQFCSCDRDALLAVYVAGRWVNFKAFWNGPYFLVRQLQKSHL